MKMLFQNEIVLKNDSTKKKVSQKFGNSGILFVVSRYGDIYLSQKPIPDGINHALIVKRYNRVMAHPLNASAHVSSDRLTIGTTQFMIEKCVHVRRLKIILWLILAGILVFAVDPIKPAREMNQAISERRDDTLIDEIKEFIKNGNMNQARISLSAILEKDPKNIQAAELIQLIDSFEKENDRLVDKEKIYDIQEIEDLYKKGLKSKKGGNYVAATAYLSNALNIIDKHDATLPIKDEIKPELAKIENEISATYLPILDRIIASVENPDNSSEEIRATKIKELKNRLSETEKAVGNNDRYKEADKKINVAAKILFDEWMSKATAAERYFGCERSILIYKDILTNMADIYAQAALIIRSRIDQCPPTTGD